MDSQSVSSRGRVSQHSDQGYASRPGSRFTRPASTRSSTPQNMNEDQLFRDDCTSPVPVSPLFTIRDPLFLRYETERRFKQNRIPWRCRKFFGVASKAPQQQLQRCVNNISSALGEIHRPGNELWRISLQVWNRGSIFNAVWNERAFRQSELCLD